MVDIDSEFKKSSLRINAIERKRLELVLGTIDNAKKNAAVDLRKSQSNYRRQLKMYRDRQKEIIMSKTSAQPTTASVGEFLLRQVLSRSSQRTRNRTLTVTRPNTAGAVLSHEPSLAGQDSKQPSLPQSNGILHNRTASAFTQRSGQYDNAKESKLTDLETRGPSSVLRYRPHTANVYPPATANPEDGSNGERQTRSSTRVRPKTSFSSKSSPFGGHPNSALSRRTGHKPLTPFHHNGRSTTNISSRSLGNKDNEVVKHEIEQEEYEADLDLGRMSNRQRCKLDIRPTLAWGQSTAEDGNTRQNPFQVLTRPLGQPHRQIRYLEKDEIDDRGAFYKFLVEERLKEEHTRFQNICGRVDEFCKEQEPHIEGIKNQEQESEQPAEQVAKLQGLLRRQSTVTSHL